MTPHWFDFVRAVVAGIMALAAMAQAVAAGLLVYLTWRSLLVLRGYAEDTKRIADKSVEQIEKSAEQIRISAQQTENLQKPFLALVSKPADLTRNFGGGWGIENQGAGAALNIKHSHQRGEQVLVDIPPLAKGEFHFLGGYNKDLIEKQGFAMRYESLSGVEYATEVSWENAVMRTRFAIAIPHWAR